MKKLFTAIVYLICCCSANAQQTARNTINFNNNWEMFRVDSLGKFKTTLVVRNSTSFSSQFNQESIKKKDIPADSIILDEVKEAINGFEAEYPKIKALKWEKISLRAKPCHQSEAARLRQNRLSQ